MGKSIGKLSNALMTVPLTHMHVNSCFMSKDYFGCGIMSIEDAQNADLRKTCEKPLARKLGLGSNFPRKIMFGRVTAMGVGIVAPKMAIYSLTQKLHVSHERMKSENGKIIKTIENNELIEKGFKRGSSGCNSMENSGPRLWIEGERKMLEERRAKLQNQDSKEINSNKTIVEYASEQSKDKTKPKDMVKK